jgi:cytochrome c-type biogenesis protein
VIDAPFALAFTAGLVATVNPCGFAMLPAYLSYFVGRTEQDERGGRVAAVRSGLVIGAVVSSGFLLVFGLTGILITLGMRSIISVLPWAAMVIGGGLALLGVAMLAGFDPVVRLPKVSRAPEGRRTSSVFTFGVSYAVASLSCTLPVFLVVVAGAIPRANLISGVLLFVVYGLGMSLVLIVLTLALALGKQGLVRSMRRWSGHVHRASGAVLLLAGGYIVWFWASNLSDPLSASGPVVAVERWSSQLTNLIGGRPLLAGASLAVVVLVALASLAAHRGLRRTTEPKSVGGSETHQGEEQQPHAQGEDPVLGPAPSSPDGQREEHRQHDDLDQDAEVRPG